MCAQEGIKIKIAAIGVVHRGRSSSWPFLYDVTCRWEGLYKHFASHWEESRNFLLYGKAHAPSYVDKYGNKSKAFQAYCCSLNYIRSTEKMGGNHVQNREE